MYYAWCYLNLYVDCGFYGGPFFDVLFECITCLRSKTLLAWLSLLWHGRGSNMRGALSPADTIPWWAAKPSWSHLSVLLGTSLLSASFSLSSLVTLPHTCPFLGDKLQAASWRQFLCFQPEEHPSGGQACIKGIQLLGRSCGFSLFFTLPGQKGKKLCNAAVHLFIFPLEAEHRWATFLSL